MIIIDTKILERDKPNKYEVLTMLHWIKKIQPNLKCNIEVVDHITKQAEELL